MFYINVNNMTYGPYSEQQVKLMAASNQVKSDTLVFETGGKQQWLPASHFPRLFKNPSPKGIATPNPVCSSVPIKDIGLHKPFLMRVLRRGYIEYATSDQTEKRDYQRLGTIARAEDIYELLRKHVERQRQVKGVREVDFWKA